MNGVLLICALVITGLLLRRELVSQAPQVVSEDPVKVEDWPRLLEAGVHFGVQGAPVSIAVFSDFQCPFCKLFHESLQQVRREFGDRMEITYLHFPLSYHTHAIPAALASECAERQGRFEQFADAVFARQDSLGVLSWTGFATLAGVPSAAAFEACFDSVSDAKVLAGQNLAKRIGARGTPTVLVNGWKLAGAPSATELRHLVTEIASGKRFPFPPE